MTTDARMFLHGFLGSKKSCPYKKNCSIIELPGHGKNKIDETMTFDSYIDYLLAQIKDPIHLIGYSMGGRIALKMAVKRPDLFTKITILSAHPGGQGNEEEIIQKLKIEPFEDFIRWWYAQDLFTGTDIEARIKETRHLESHQLAMCLRCFSKKNQGDLWGALAPIAHKMRYICGQLDKKYLEIGHKLKVYYPAIKLFVIEQASHNVYSSDLKAIINI